MPRNISTPSLGTGSSPSPSDSPLASVRRCVIRPLTAYCTSPEATSLRNVFVTSLSGIAAYYAWRLGWFLGRLSRTPEIASVFDDRRVLGTLASNDLRYYVWLLLWTVACTSLWSAFIILKSAQLDLEHNAGGALHAHLAAAAPGAPALSSVSPKLGLPMTYSHVYIKDSEAGLPSVMSRSESHRENRSRFAAALADLAAFETTDPTSLRRRRLQAASRLRTSLIFLAFTISFVKKQHVGSTLYYHPVNSPLITGEDLTHFKDRHYTPDVAMHGGRGGLGLVEEPYFGEDLPHLEPAAVASTDAPFQSVRGLEDEDDGSAHVVAAQGASVVPNIVHFVFGMEEDFGGKPFNFATYLSMYSAIKENRPERVMFWYHFLPSTSQKQNWWFERILKDASDLGVTIELKRARDFDEIFGNPIVKFAHKADIIRIEALLEHGGIYLDLDVFTIRSFAPLLRFETVMGLEGGVPPMPRQGLCNAIIVSSATSPYLRRWYEAYRTFRDSDWAGHSVKLPLKLAVRHPDEIVVLDPFAMFYPLWNDDGLRMVHSRAAEMGGEGWDFDDSQQFAYHAWSSFAGKRWLSRINPDKIFEIETSFNVLLRRWTSEQLRKDWRAAREAGLLN